MQKKGIPQTMAENENRHQNKELKVFIWAVVFILVHKEGQLQGRWKIDN